MGPNRLTLRVTFLLLAWSWTWHPQGHRRVPVGSPEGNTGGVLGTCPDGFPPRHLGVTRWVRMQNVIKINNYENTNTVRTVHNLDNYIKLYLCEIGESYLTEGRGPSQSFNQFP
jgi:hypothetical protein